MNNQTTQRIKDTLGATYTVAEVTGMLTAAQEKSDAQAPYFDGRLLDRIALLQAALGLDKLKIVVIN